ncbi:Elongation of very long chain fatty acids-like protein 1 [Sarcoptes scabiei]|uniref:Elongation of very long chain fatty acids protein n=1 Tax=Sarcoptes scabiei TaxID=52283 RepID=A0A131ZXG8_SARSC|nr:Elongation of very long chain fatty acids-like protein 1 [Sarcoptes scabiei]
MKKLIVLEPVNLFGLNLPNKRFHDNYIVRPDLKWSNETSSFPGMEYSFPFEKFFLPIGKETQQFANDYWHYCFYISAIYLVTIFSLQYWMRSRESYNLRTPLFYWNILLSIFSILGTFRCAPEFFDIILNEGIAASFTKSSYYKDYRLTLWYLWFTVSKAFELIDTLFIVLRKTKLIPLHWVHHLLTLTFSWFVFPDVPATARWMVNMNFFVHSLMYTYYALKAVKIQIPKQVNITITILQVTQMFLGLYIHYQSLKLKLLGQPVDASYSVLFVGSLLYSIFAILFVQFFIRTYILTSRPMRILKEFSQLRRKNATDKKCQ